MLPYLPESSYWRNHPSFCSTYQLQEIWETKNVAMTKKKHSKDSRISASTVYIRSRSDFLGDTVFNKVLDIVSWSCHLLKRSSGCKLYQSTRTYYLYSPWSEPSVATFFLRVRSQNLHPQRFLRTNANNVSQCNIHGRADSCNIIEMKSISGLVREHVHWSNSIQSINPTFCYI